MSRLVFACTFAVAAALAAAASTTASASAAAAARTKSQLAHRSTPSLTIDLSVELLNQRPESIKLTTSKDGTRELHLATYFFGEKKIRERVVPDSIYASFRASFPMAAMKTNADCAADLAITVATKPVFVCSKTWSKETRSAFAKWFASTRDKIFD